MTLTSHRFQNTAKVAFISEAKDEISGAGVKRVYYEENDLPRILKYCEKDVMSLMRVYRKMVGD